MPKELQQKSIKSNRKNDLTSRDNKDNKVDKEEVWLLSLILNFVISRLIMYVV